MRVVALVSGGKDSSYNMMKCVAEGHEIIALANLHPRDKGMFFEFISKEKHIFSFENISFDLIDLSIFFYLIIRWIG